MRDRSDSKLPKWWLELSVTQRVSAALFVLAGVAAIYTNWFLMGVLGVVAVILFIIGSMIRYH